MFKRGAELSAASVVGSIDDRTIAGIRLILAATALIIIYLDPSEPDRQVLVTYAALVLYTIYSAILYQLAKHMTSDPVSVTGDAHWADVCWYLLLIALSSGTNSLFFQFFFFSILVASIRWGFASGMRVTIVSAILFTIIGYLTSPVGPGFEWNRFLLRPVYLIVLGYMMARLGDHEIKLMRRLALLKEISSLSNPRFGVDRTLGIILERLRAFYDGDHCVMLMKDLDSGEFLLRRADRRDPESGSRSEPLNEEMRRRLISLPENYAVIYSDQRGPRDKRAQCYVYDEGGRVADRREECESLAALLDAKSYISVPLFFRNESLGRVFITSKRRQRFKQADMDFLLQAVKHFMPQIDNIRLVDKLASDAAEQERKRIARDIHDSVIQPYIGLQIGLTAINQKLAKGGPDVDQDVESLIEMTGTAIDSLRSYVSGLKENGEQEDSLLSSLRRFAAKYTEVTGINVIVDAQAYSRINDRLAAEAFQMATEGLSNVRRHTQATLARILLSCEADKFVLRIENDRMETEFPVAFTPYSIKDRAASLGGQTRVEQSDEGGTAIIVEIPL